MGATDDMYIVYVHAYLIDLFWPRAALQNGNVMITIGKNLPINLTACTRGSGDRGPGTGRPGEQDQGTRGGDKSSMQVR